LATSALSQLCYPRTQALEIHEVEDPVRWDFCLKGRCEAELDEGQLIRLMRVRPERDSHASLPRDLEKGKVQVLPIGVTVDLNRLVQFRGFGKDAGPIGL
jgi:hypothetical protein